MIWAKIHDTDDFDRYVNIDRCSRVDPGSADAGVTWHIVVTDGTTQTRLGGSWDTKPEVGAAISRLLSLGSGRAVNPADL